MAGIASLPLFHQIAGKPVLVLGDGDAADARKRLIERAGGMVVSDATLAAQAGARIAFVAIEDAVTAREAADELREAGLLVNVTDQPELCDFTVPSILDRDPVLIAVGTGGASAGLAKQLRLRLERILPQSLGALARRLYNARENLRRRLPDAADRRRAIDGALREGGPLDPLDATSADRVDAWASNAEADAASRTETIALASGDPEDLTLRQARLMGEADALVLEGEIPAAILARARADAVRLAPGETGKRAGLTVRLVAPDQAA